MLTTHGYDVDETPACLWNISDPHDPRLLSVVPAARGGNNVRSAAISPDNRTLVTGAQEALVWDISNPKKPEQRPGVSDGFRTVTELAFTGRDNTTLAISTYAAGVQLWKIGPRPARIAFVPGSTGDIGSMAVSRDGRILAAGSGDHDAYMWDVSRPAAPRLLRRLVGHTTRVWKVHLSPDGGRLLTTSLDVGAPVRLWDLTGRSPGPYAILRGRIRAATLTGDADGIATVMTDGSMRTWHTDPDRFAVTACGLAGAPMTAGERDLYLAPPYEPACH
ncbi:WD40 repeat domain-containing protein [Nonomuraea sp. NPDC049480]|uniref:WD40 repeat domain-containing protein n=1 Tax=Nonomuraea sp. NPDC049480 TaxID=3364353 RepID=UPI0037B4C19D